MEMMVAHGVEWKTSATVTSIKDGFVTYRDEDGEHELAAATVVSGFGYKAYNPLEEAARKVCDNVQVVGCAVKAGNALTACGEAYAAAVEL
jgi:NADH dehydrogenase FAD-containing subunit